LLAVRILFLGTDFVWPADSGGRVRTLSQLRVLCSLADVSTVRLFSVHEDEIAAAHREALLREIPKLELADPVFHPIHLFRHPRYVPHVAWLRIARGVPYLGGKWDSPRVRDALTRELTDARWDVVWLNGLGIGHYLPLIRELAPSARVVLDQHNVESDRFAQFAKRRRGLARAVAKAEWRAARSWERDLLRGVDAVGAISPDDAQAYRELAGVESFTVPQVITPTAWKESTHGEARFCWIGSLSWGPNAQGLNWFCSQVWPIIRARLPQATCEIVGSGLPLDRRGLPDVPAAWQVPGVITRGRVEDLRPVYARASAMVAPIVGGAGIRIKLLEAFRHGLPTVTTPDGAAGLPIEPGREAFVESAPEPFACRTVTLATSPSTRSRLRKAGYAFLERHNRLADAQSAASALLGVALDQAALEPTESVVA
jgi:glycosyltransferase involved in cell wall biosynthesis